MTDDAELPDYIQTFRDFWAPIVAPNGVLDMDQVMRELYDFHVLMGNVSRVYDNLTFGRISKPLTDPDVVISVVEQLQEEPVAGIVAVLEDITSGHHGNCWCATCGPLKRYYGESPKNP